MKKQSFIILLIIVAVSSSAFSIFEIQGTCDAPIVGDHSGAPGETNCTGCHPGTANTGSGTLDFHVGNDSTYVPGQTYSCSVEMMQSGINKFGFVNLALKNSANTTIGSFGLIDTVRTRKYTLGIRNYFSHTPCGADADTIGHNAWNYTWTSPSSNVGNITLYFSALATNHNHATSGDFTYTGTIVLTPTTATDIIDDDLNAGIDIYPNPAKDVLTVSTGSMKASSIKINVSDVTGKMVLAKNVKLPLGKVELDIHSLNEGMYFISISLNDKVYKRKFEIVR